MDKNRALLVVGILLFGVALWIGLAGKGGAKNGDTVTVDYTVRLEDGTVYDTSGGAQPLQLTLGEHKLIAGLEEAVIGMQVGDQKTVTVPPEKAYGIYRPELVGVFPISQLPESVPPEVGQELQMTAKDGSQVPAVISAVSDDAVTLDANPPLAGQTLTLEIELLTIEGTTVPFWDIQVSLGWVLLMLAVLIAGFIIIYRGSQRQFTSGHSPSSPRKLHHHVR